MTLHSPCNVSESAKQVVAGDCEHFALLKEKEPMLAETDVLCQ
jgi:hypothetical protein